jgi:hypothetical protein
MSWLHHKFRSFALPTLGASAKAFLDGFVAVNCGGKWSTMLHLKRRLAPGTSDMPEAAMRQNIKGLRRNTGTKVTLKRGLSRPSSALNILRATARVA